MRVDLQKHFEKKRCKKNRNESWRYNAITKNNTNGKSQIKDEFKSKEQGSNKEQIEYKGTKDQKGKIEETKASADSMRSLRKKYFSGFYPRSRSVIDCERKFNWVKEDRLKR